jgi:acetyl esterase
MLRASRDGPAVRHLALLYPMVDPTCDSASMHEFARGYMLAREGVQWSWSQYLAEPADASNPLVALLHADPASFPPTSVVTAEYDPLRDEGEALAARLQAAGVAVVARRYAGMVHGFTGLPQLTPVAAQAIDDIASDIRKSVT